MTNYLNEEDEEDKYSSEEKISDDVPQIEADDDNDDNEWGSDEDDDDWGTEKVRVEGGETSDTVEEPMDSEEYSGGDEVPDSIEEPSTAEINSSPSSEEPKGFRVLSFEDFVSNK